MESLTTSPVSSGSAPVETAVQYSLPGYNVYVHVHVCAVIIQYSRTSFADSWSR